MDSLKQFNPRYYLQYGLSILSRRRWLFFFPSFLVLCGATVVSFTSPKIYQSSITVLIERDQVINPLTKGLGVSSDMEERLRTLRQGISSRPLLERVIKKLDLDIEVKTPLEFEKLIEQVQRNLAVTVRGKDLFTVSYRGKDPVKVKEVVDTLTGMYIEENLSAKRSETYAAFDFINEQLQLYKKKLEESEKALREFKEANLRDLTYDRVLAVEQEGETGVQIGNPIGGLLGAQSQNSNLSKLEAYQTSLSEAEIALKEANLKRSLLKKQLAGEEPMTITSTTPRVIVDPVEKKLKELEIQLMTLLTQYTEQHPDIIRLKSEMVSLKKQLESSKPVVARADMESSKMSASNPVYQTLQQELNNVEIQINTLEGRRDELQRKVEEYSIKVKTIPLLEQEHIRLTRDYRVNESIYQKLLNRLEEARISRELEVKQKSGTFTVVEPAVLPLKPVKPNRLVILLMGLVGGLGAGLGAIVLIELSYQPLHSYKEAEAYLGVPILAAIPKILTQEDIKRRKRSNRLMASLCGAYLLVTGGLLAWQTVQADPSYLQNLIQKFQSLPTMAKEVLKD